MQSKFYPAKSPSDVVEFKRRFALLAVDHPRIILQHSGGRDSIAVYKMLESFLPYMTVVWTNSGDLFPEITEYMAGVREKTPKFVEITSDTPHAIKTKGYPADVLPVDYTDIGQACTESKSIKLRNYLECCYENISYPMHKYVKESRATLVIRGNRKSESHRTPVENGAVVDGVQYIFPIWDWTDEQVVDYIRSTGEEITPRLQIHHSSLDCKSCTAYTGHSQERMQYIKQYHPIVFQNLQGVFKEIKKAQEKESEGLDKILSM